MHGDLCRRLREAFEHAGYTAEGVDALLGPHLRASLARPDGPEPVVRATRDAGDLGVLLRLLHIGETEPAAAVARALAPLELSDAVSAGLLEVDGNAVTASVCVRTYRAGDGSWWTCEDFRPDRRGRVMKPDYVLGVGLASQLLARATPSRPVGSVLDVGCGNGLQTLHASARASALTATDIAPRALALARGTFGLNGLDVELLEGSWFEPVDGRQFDQIVCNPPFVVGPPRVDFTFRDSGLGGDDAPAAVVRESPRHLRPGGTAHLLAEWIHRRGESWQDHVAGWVPDGTDAWFVQKAVQDPARYVSNWLVDASVDPTSPHGRAKTAQWLDWFDAEHIEGIGFGHITLRRTDGDATVSCDDIGHNLVGEETAAWLDRTQWLREHPDLLGERLRVADSVLLERYLRTSPDGWQPTGQTLFRLEAPSARPQVDAFEAALLAACGDGSRLTDVIRTLTATDDRPAETVRRHAVDVATRYLRKGVLQPAEKPS